MSITRVKLLNWRNFPSLDITLQDRMFIIGPNASGKSNLLDVFRFLRDIAKEQGGGLQKAIEDRGGISKLRCYAARSKSNIELEVHLSRSETVTATYSYRLVLGTERSGLHRPIIKIEEVRKNGRLVFSRPDEKDQQDPERLTETYLEQTAANKEFREIASFFSSICYLHIVPQMVRTPESARVTSLLGDDPFGRAFLERIAKTDKRVLKSRLNRIEKCLKTIAPQLTELSFKPDEKGQPHLVAKYEHWRPDAGHQNEIHFSDGTLRAIGLLWSLQETFSLLLIEEPELSLNAEIVKVLPALFSRVLRKNKRQLFISTHSYDLLSDKGISPEETLVLLVRNEQEGTSVVQASDDKVTMALYKSGLSIAETALPQAAPVGAIQLSLNFDKNDKHADE